MKHLNIIVTVLISIVLGLYVMYIIGDYYYSILRKKQQKKKPAPFEDFHEEAESKIADSLNVLRQGKTRAVKANAIITLMMYGYILIHTMVNKGNDFKDKEQTDIYCSYLTPRFIGKLFSVGGTDEQYTP